MIKRFLAEGWKTPAFPKGYLSPKIFKRCNMIIYDSSDIQELVNDYIEKGGDYFQIEEGCLGWGFLILHDYGKTLKTIIVREVCLNEWSCGHIMRMYKKCPKKYMALIEDI